jgi:hypothetical protein
MCSQNLEWLETKTSSSFTVGPNAVVEWLTLGVRVWEVPGSNLGPETGYPY